MFVPSQLKSNKIKDDLEFEWLLCIASTLMVGQAALRECEKEQQGDGTLYD